MYYERFSYISGYCLDAACSNVGFLDATGIRTVLGWIHPVQEHREHPDEELRGLHAWFPAFLLRRLRLHVWK